MVAIPKAGSLRKCERASAEWKGGAEHEAGDLVSDKEIMVESLGVASRKDPSGGEVVVWKVTWPRRC